MSVCIDNLQVTRLDVVIAKKEKNKTNSGSFQVCHVLFIFLSFHS